MSNACAGSGVWFGEQDPRNTGVRVPHNEQSNQAAEMYAVTLAHMLTPPFAPLHIVSDSKYVVEGLTQHLPKWERRGWIGVANAEVIKEAVAHLRTRSAPTTFRWVKGHANERGNEEADRLAREGANLPQQLRPVALPPSVEYVHEGASLSDLTQSLAYKGIRARTPRPARRATTRGVSEAVASVAKTTGAEHREAALWMLLRKDPIAKRVRDFIWKALHQAFRVGGFWSNIPGYEERSRCSRCNCEESMEHILTECGAPGQTEVWDLTRQLLSKKGVTLPVMTLGAVTGAHLWTIMNEKDEIRCGATRLARMIVGEAAYLVWKLRCERVIGWADEPQKTHSREEIANRWMATVNKRLSMDCAMTSKRLAGRHVIAQEVVEATWGGVLHDEKSLPRDWACMSGVFVGKLTLSEVRDNG
ncbi:ribonuclease H-like protein [Trametes versicolor FP-101664 SS1]|uniref:ribonuclease H-like protein n=1 Tax=Trametes versicolor (strain FP-101664) TaxID=717944 RepID=UPI0004623E4E|nr:ribonuclease H-like protein [Trametes versicolor FP-101664 SS1]EIW61280.1 ribonuclease H-like protein [Trametes versicolor FP-101664 SS1]